MINPALKTKRRKVQSRPAGKQKFYQCPACREMVDKSDMAAIQWHHQHVLHPPPFAYVKLPYFEGQTGR
jgi:hypothetical protein